MEVDRAFDVSALVQDLRGDYVGMVLYFSDEHDILRPHVPRLLPAKRSLIRTTSSVHTGGELRCLSFITPRGTTYTGPAAYIRILFHRFGLFIAIYILIGVFYNTAPPHIPSAAGSRVAP